MKQYEIIMFVNSAKKSILREIARTLFDLNIIQNRGIAEKIAYKATKGPMHICYKLSKSAKKVREELTKAGATVELLDIKIRDET